MKITFYSPIKIWNIIWEPYLLPALVSAVNSWCNRNVMVCCPGATVQQSTIFLQFNTASQIVIGQGYPQEIQQGSLWQTIALLYAAGAPNNDLCKMYGVARKRRALPDNTLSQSVFESVLTEMKTNLTNTLMQCCNTTLSSIDKAVPETQQTDIGMFLGLSLYIWIAIIASGVFVLILVIVLIVCYCCVKQRNQSKPKSSQYLTPSAPQSPYMVPEIAHPVPGNTYNNLGYISNWQLNNGNKMDNTPVYMYALPNQ